MNSILEARLSQALTALNQAKMDKECYVRICAVLVKVILGDEKVGSIENGVVVTKAQFDAVPKLWQIGVASAKVSATDPAVDPTAVPEDVFVVTVKAREEPKRLVVASAAP